jgi:hypothetical protein
MSLSSSIHLGFAYTLLIHLRQLSSQLLEEENVSYENMTANEAADRSTSVESSEPDHEYDRLFRTEEEDGFDAPTTTRREIWAYYLYYNGSKASICPQNIHY